MSVKYWQNPLALYSVFVEIPLTINASDILMLDIFASCYRVYGFQHSWNTTLIFVKLCTLILMFAYPFWCMNILSEP
jgi:hypothetical protein